MIGDGCSGLAAKRLTEKGCGLSKDDMRADTGDWQGKGSILSTLLNF